MHDEPRLGPLVMPDPPAVDPSWSWYPIAPSSGLSHIALSVERPG